MYPTKRNASEALIKWSQACRWPFLPHKDVNNKSLEGRKMITWAHFTTKWSYCATYTGQNSPVPLK